MRGVRAKERGCKQKGTPPRSKHPDVAPARSQRRPCKPRPLENAWQFFPPTRLFERGEGGRRWGDGKRKRTPLPAEDARARVNRASNLATPRERFYARRTRPSPSPCVPPVRVFPARVSPGIWREGDGTGFRHLENENLLAMVMVVVAIAPLLMFLGNRHFADPRTSLRRNLATAFTYTPRRLLLGCWTHARFARRARWRFLLV